MIAVWLLAAALGLYALHRLELYLEGRRWIYALMPVRLSVVAAAACFVWCLLVGVLIWTTPVVSSGIERRAHLEFLIQI